MNHDVSRRRFLSTSLGAVAGSVLLPEQSFTLANYFPQPAEAVTSSTTTIRAMKGTLEINGKAGWLVVQVCALVGAAISKMSWRIPGYHSIAASTSSPLQLPAFAPSTPTRSRPRNPRPQPRVFQSGHNHVPNLAGMELGKTGNEMRLPGMMETSQSPRHPYQLI